VTDPQGGSTTEGGHPQPESPPTSKLIADPTAASGGDSTEGGHPQPEGDEPTN
jgi:hypothetical protein